MTPFRDGVYALWRDVTGKDDPELPDTETVDSALGLLRPRYETWVRIIYGIGRKRGNPEEIAAALGVKTYEGARIMKAPVLRRLGHVIAYELEEVGPDHPQWSTRPIETYDFTAREITALRSLNVSVPTDLGKVRKSDLRKLRNCGRKTIKRIRELLLAPRGLDYGYKLPPEKRAPKKSKPEAPPPEPGTSEWKELPITRVGITLHSIHRLRVYGMDTVGDVLAMQEIELRRILRRKGTFPEVQAKILEPGGYRFEAIEESVPEEMELETAVVD